MGWWSVTGCRLSSVAVQTPSPIAKLSEVVIDTLADFHAVDPAAAGLGDLGHPEGFLERQVGGWIERFAEG